tara:strand:+ start:796 stop:1377 length:582 start_codon:yes stop_codon:yes gene_type:complete
MGLITIPIIGGAQSVKNEFVNNTFLNPTVGRQTTNTIGVNRLHGFCYSIDNQIVINGVTITCTGAGGVITSAIYKYDSDNNNFAKVTNTETNGYNTAVSGFQTVSITETTLDQGIYLNLIHSDTQTTNFLCFDQPKKDTPLGRDSSGNKICGFKKFNFSLSGALPTTVDNGAPFFLVGVNFFEKYSSFLLNMA